MRKIRPDKFIHLENLSGVLSLPISRALYQSRFALCNNRYSCANIFHLYIGFINRMLTYRNALLYPHITYYTRFLAISQDPEYWIHPIIRYSRCLTSCKTRDYRVPYIEKNRLIVPTRRIWLKAFWLNQTRISSYHDKTRFFITRTFNWFYYKDLVSIFWLDL